MDCRAVLSATLVTLVAAASSAGAAVIVIQNRTADRVEFEIRNADGSNSFHHLAAGTLEPIAVSGPVDICFDIQGTPCRYPLQPNTLHSFLMRDGSVDLLAWPIHRVEPAGRASIRMQPSVTNPAGKLKNHTVPVMVLADDAEPATRAIWEKRLRDRMAAASEIFERHCRVRFEVVAVDTWKSDKDAADFTESVVEFEREVRPTPPAKLAVGFTGRFHYLPEEKHVGGTRGPLRPHILIRDAFRRLSEPERLEVLVHELGHYLGAVHSAERTSVMRPRLGDRQAVVRRFQIQFDAPNTLAMCVIADELRERPILSLHELSSGAKGVLRGTYEFLSEALPNDPAGPAYETLLDVRLPPKLLEIGR